MGKLVVWLFCGLLSIEASAKHDDYKYYKQFRDIFDQVGVEYVEDPDRQKMTDAAIDGMMRSLDPYSSYITGDECKELMSQLSGEFGGVGVEVYYLGDGIIHVISPIDGLPAEKVGISAGDYIIAVNDESVSTLGFHKAVRNMRGDPGTKVKLTVVHDGKIQDYELTREIVKIRPVKFGVDGEIGYVRIASFSENTFNDLKKGVKAIVTETKGKLKGIILDLRNNPGGLIDQAAKVSEFFIKEGLIVSTKGRSSSSNTSVYSDRSAEKAPFVPVVVLINNGSASASEIVAGALQDHKRGVILGVRSFGKGSVQTIKKVGDDAMLRITSAWYYTPSGKLIHNKGIDPDILAQQAEVKYLGKNNDKQESKNNEKDDKGFTKGNISKIIEDRKNKKKEDNAGNKPISSAVHEAESKSIMLTDENVRNLHVNDYQYSRAYDLICGLNVTKDDIKVIGRNG